MKLQKIEPYLCYLVGASRTWGCHGHSPVKPEFAQVLFQTLRHQFPSSFIDHESNLYLHHDEYFVCHDM